jgi:sugar phosphate isomerase/epimerase
MARPVTIFTGQWADIPFDDLCVLMKKLGYDGLEIACWGDHMDVRKASSDKSYVDRKKATLAKNGLECHALGAHLAGQCVGDYNDPRLDGFAPAQYKGKPAEIRKWAVEEMIHTARAAAAMGCQVVTGFLGSPVWKYFYSFPQTTQEMVDQGYQEIKDLWTPIFDEFDKAGVRFALEVHPSEIAYDYWSTVKLFEVFENRPTLGLNFDPSHLLWQGVTPHLFLRDFASRVYHVHMKDAAVTLDGRSGILGSHLAFGDARRGWNFRSIGHGQVDFESIIRELNSAGYTGPLSVEWEDNGMEREFGAAESLEFVKKINFAPSNVDFDGAMEN